MGRRVWLGFEAFKISFWPMTCGAKGTRTPGLLDANQTLFQLSYSPGCLPTRVPGAYWLERIPRQDKRQAQSRRLLEQAGQAAVGQRLAAGLAGRAVLQRGVGERDLLDRVATHRAILAGPPVHAQAALLLALQVRRGQARRTLHGLSQRGLDRVVQGGHVVRGHAGRELEG